MDTTGKKHDIFICSAREDNGVSLAICTYLEEWGLPFRLASSDIGKLLLKN